MSWRRPLEYPNLIELSCSSPAVPRQVRFNCAFDCACTQLQPLVSVRILHLACHSLTRLSCNDQADQQSSRHLQVMTCSIPCCIAHLLQPDPWTALDRWCTVPKPSSHTDSRLLRPVTGECGIYCHFRTLDWMQLPYGNKIALSLQKLGAALLSAASATMQEKSAPVTVVECRFRPVTVWIMAFLSAAFGIRSSKAFSSLPEVFLLFAFNIQLNTKLAGLQAHVS